MRPLSISRAAATAQPSGVRYMFELAKQYTDAINLTLGEPGYATPSYITEAAIRSLQNGQTKYTPNAGIRPLREAIAHKLRTENGIVCDPDRQLVVTAGATQALMLVMSAILDPGDEVILQGPNWPDYQGQIDMCGARAVYALVDAAHEFKMTADIIEPLITDKTRLIIVNSPSNPTGGVLHAKELADIAALARRYGLYVISDEPYERIVYDGFRQSSLASLPDTEDFVITVNSFSKTYAMTGFRVGYICACARLTEVLIKLQENMIASVPEPMQRGAIEAIRYAQTDVARMVEGYDRNRRTLVEGINRIRGFSCLLPRGAFYAFPSIREMGMCSREAAEDIVRKTHVVTAPGSAFGPGGEGHLRICYACTHERIVEALDRLARAYGTK